MGIGASTAAAPFGSGGGASSAPASTAALFSAAKRGDARQLDALLRRIPDPSHARHLLRLARDASGRTPLHVAAARGDPACVGVLLAWGADPNAPRAPPPGTAAANVAPPTGAHGRGRASALAALGAGATPLHEAVAARRGAAVDALLAGGASPWLENAAGYTPYDLALCPEGGDGDGVGEFGGGGGGSSGALASPDGGGEGAAIARRIETCGAGASFAGYVAVRTPTSLANSWTGSADKVRWASIVPRLEPPSGPGGAAGHHQQPQQPGLVRSELLLFRDAGGADPRARLWLDGASAYPVTSGGGGRPGAAAGGPPALPTSALLRLHPSHEPPRRVAARQDGSGSWAVVVRPATRGPARASCHHDFARFVEACNVRRPPPGLVAGGGSGAHGAAGMGAAPAAGGVLAPSPWGGHGGGGGGGGGAAAAVAAAGLQRPQHLQQAQLLRGPSRDDPADGLRARPGESDEAFARRVAEAEGGGDGGAGQAAAVAVAAAAAAAGRPPSTTAAAAAITPGADVPVADAHPFLPPPGSAAAAAAAPAAAAAAAAAAATTTLRPPAAANATGSVDSHPPTVATDATGTDDGDDGGEDGRTCVVCLSEPRNAGLLHGSTVHRCVCRGCAHALLQAAGRGRRAALCPVCRAPIERVLDIF
jgi:hypothetical protein